MAPDSNGSLRKVTISVPVPQKEELLIRVEAAGVNPADVEQRKGMYPPPVGASPILGLEVSGTVTEVGAGVKGFPIGTRVMALVSGGGYADYCVAPAQTTFVLSEKLSFVQAAALPEACFTVWFNVFILGALQPGEWLLVQGGTGGVGSVAIQVAKALGARVIATARTEEKCAICKKLGADYAFCYERAEFVEEIKKATQGHGIDVILDMVGASYLSRHLQVLAHKGRLVLIDSRSGDVGAIDLGEVISKRLLVTGSLLRPSSIEEKTRMAEGIAQHVLSLLEQGRLQPLIYREFPMEHAMEAHRLLEQGSHTGKLVLRIT